MALAIGAVFGSNSAATEVLRRVAPELVVVDEDWNVPGDFICEAYLPLLLESPRVRVIALTCVTGDAWRDEGAANVLRFLEEVGRPDLPVAKGAVFPLVNTRKRLSAWEKKFGGLFWKGAWNDPEREAGAHPDTPFAVRFSREGPPRHNALTESAVTLMIRLVHEHPREITFLSGGPMTNLALAVRQDPEFASLTKRLVFASEGFVRNALAGKSGRPGFNFYFDPEAAHIVLTAGWPEIVCIDPESGSDPILNATMLAEIQKHPTPASNFLARNTGLTTPLWSTCAALIVDPALATSEQKTRMRLDVSFEAASSNFGSFFVAPQERYDGPAGGAMLTVITGFSWKRYTDDYRRSLQTPLR